MNKLLFCFLLICSFIILFLLQIFSFYRVSYELQRFKLSPSIRTIGCTITALIKSSNENMREEALQKLLIEYRITSNTNTPTGIAPAELVFARKIELKFLKLLLTPKRIRRNTKRTEFCLKN